MNQSAIVIPFIPVGKIRCYITGTLRKETPEEHVRQRWARSLVDEYKYDKSDIAIEYKIKMGSSTKRADLVVFKHNAEKKQDSIFIIVEAKRADVLPKNKDEGIKQLKTYMSACHSCRFGLWVGAEKLAYEKTSNDNEHIVDIPSFGDIEPRIPTFLDLVPAVDLKAIFRRCHNYIYVNQGIQKAEAFQELLKLIFAKVYDEKESTDSVRFFIRNEERRSEAGQRRVQEERIDPLFNAVQEQYRYIFKSNENIELNKRVLAYVVSELQKYSLLTTKADIKGTAYEELVGANLRGDRGEYFTPRNVCDMAVKMVLATYPQHKLTSLKVIDTCCGTGGFLVSIVNYLREVIYEREKARGGSDIEINYRVSDKIKDIARLNIFGIDINPFLVRTAQMNLVMHGDGSCNIFQADSLYSPKEWENSEAINKIEHAKFDIVVTNPPFGGKAIIDDPHLLSHYQLSTFDSKEPRNVLPAEQLFVEGAWKYLKPGGRMAIVLPDSILNNPSLKFIRKWLFKRARIIASVDLPKETFAESGGVPNPSVLVVQRLTKDEIKLAEKDALDDNSVFMAIPKTVGRDKRGNAVYYKTLEGFEVLDENMEPTLDDEASLVAQYFTGWAREAGYVHE